MGPLKGTYTYIKVGVLSNKIAGLCRLLALSLSIPEDKIYQPAENGDNGNKVPEDFGFC